MKKFLVALCLFLLFVGVIAIIVIISYKNWTYMSGHSTELSVIGGTILGLLAGYIILSLGTVKIDEVACRTRFDKPVGEQDRGLYFAPLGIDKILTAKRTIYQDELPADPELIFTGEGAPPKGMFLPVRIKFGSPDPTDTDLLDDPYNKKSMVIAVTPVVGWRITDAITFFSVMGSVENCRKQLGDKAVTAVSSDLAKMTPAKASLLLDGTINPKIKTKLLAETSTWGIEISDGYLKPFQFSHKLNTAVEGDAIAEQNAKAAIKTARGAAEVKQIDAVAEKFKLSETGRVKLDRSGKVTELVPDPNIATAAEAIGKHQGALVLGDGATKTLLGIGGKEEK